MHDGLLQVAGAAALPRFAASVLSTGLDPALPDLGVRVAVAQAALHTGAVVALEGPEHALAGHGGDPAALAAGFVGAFHAGLEAEGLRGTVHLNLPAAAAWAGMPAAGSLFASVGAAGDRLRVRCLAESIARAAHEHGPGCRVHVAWHLTPAELNAEPPPVLLDLVARSAGGGAIEFVIDRARQPVALGAGLGREDSEALLFVGLPLARLVEQVTPASPERFLARLGSLTRIARSAGHARVDFLRRRGGAELTRGFRLERARLVVVPIGLDEAVRRLADSPLCDQGAGTSLGRQIITQLHQALTSEPPHNMVAVVDGLPQPMGFGFDVPLPLRPDAAGLTSWDADAPLRQQLRCCGSMHSIVRAGVAAIQFPAAAPPPVNDLAGVLRLAGHFEVQRLRFLPIQS